MFPGFALGMLQNAELKDAIDPWVPEPLVIEAPAGVPKSAESQPKDSKIVFVDRFHYFKLVINGCTGEEKKIVFKNMYHFKMFHEFPTKL